MIHVTHYDNDQSRALLPPPPPACGWCGDVEELDASDLCAECAAVIRERGEDYNE